MEKLKSALEEALQKVDSKFECEILGSYRRGVGFSSDIDLAVRHKKFTDKDDEEVSKPLMAAIIKQLEDDGLIDRENQLMLGPKKYAVRSHPTFPLEVDDADTLSSHAGSHQATRSPSLSPNRYSSGSLRFLPLHAPWQ
jgi:DNA-binding HxlR family transcriptional regulator